MLSISVLIKHLKHHFDTRAIDHRVVVVFLPPFSGRFKYNSQEMSERISKWVDIKEATPVFERQPFGIYGQSQCLRSDHGSRSFRR
jgi:hypothetical protein